VLQIKSLIVLLALCSITTLYPAFGQTSSSPITVTTDKTTYSDGSTITISGTVSEQLNVPISIVIKDSSQHVVLIDQVNPDVDANGNISYSAQAVAGGSLWTSAGTYEIDVTYASQDRTAKTTFDFTGPQTQQVTNQTSTNQTNPNQVIPEFGPLAGMIITVSTISIIVASRRFHF
jgi:predicted secreted protein with PEFG-CTERM motif